MPAYSKPNYRTGIRAGASRYRPYNGLVSGSSSYMPGSAKTNENAVLTFSGAPGNGNQIIVVPDIGSPAIIFTFTYSGSPGPGVIPLVAGGGTAAQAATQTQVAFAAQLLKWVVTNPSSGVVNMVFSRAGFNPSISTGATNLALVVTPAVLSVLPGRFGKNFCILPG